MKRAFTVLLVTIAVLAICTSLLSQSKAPVQKPQKAVDPVCGLTVDKDADLSYSYKSETYYFCSKADLEKFKKTPDKYIKKSS